MLYRVEIDISVSDEKDAVKLLNEVEKIKTMVYLDTDNPLPIEQKAMYYKCRHDENPPAQCSDYISVIWTDPEKVHVEKDV